HRYLHESEKTQHVFVAYKQDRERMAAAFKRVGTIPFKPDVQTGDAAKGQLLKEELKHLLDFSSFGKYQAIKVDAGPRDWGSARGSWVVQQIKQAGYQRVSVGRTDLGGDVAVVRVEEDDAARVEYNERWSRLSAAHE